MRGGSCEVTNQGQVCLDPREVNSFAQSLHGPAWFNQNLTISHVLGHGKVGFTVINLFDDVKNPVLSANFNYLNTDSSNNWTPQGRCGTPTNFIICFDAYVPAPNGEYYPAVGYYQQKSLQPRAVNFWY